MTGEVVIRIAEPHEGDNVGVLTERVYVDSGFADDGYSTILRDGSSRAREAIVLVAELDGRLVGTVTAALPGTPFAEIAAADELEVRMLAVAEDARRRRIADSLMEAVETLARQHGLRGVVLSTQAEMHGARRLYERRGYVRQPDRDWSIGAFVLLVYRLELTGS